MAEPKLTLFLLKLSTNQRFLEKYKKAKLQGAGAQAGILTAAGLTPKQQKAVLSNNSRMLVDAVMEELGRHSSIKHPYKGGGLAIVLPMGPHLQGNGPRGHAGA